MGRPTARRTRGAGPTEPQLRVNQAVTIDLDAGQQVDYVLRVDETRSYTVGTFGAADTVLALFEEVDGEPRFLAGDDDSGTDRSAAITHRLRPGRTYFVRMRLVYKGTRGTVTLMCW